ncbi:MAG: TPM domain-containing protein [Pyrinomonadaceae bacterium]|nr:TPM domain-containing protein [Pyrinomonadaceae bacterium]
MNKKLLSKPFRILLLTLFLALVNALVFSQEGSQPFSINESPLPAPTSPVMDYVGVLDANTKQALEQKIIAFRDASNPKVELAVAIVATTAERPIADYSLAVSRGWKIGSPEQDNPSALLFIAVNDRKYFTQVSRDLEDELPDGLVGQLQRDFLVPALRQQNYNKAVTDTIDAYIRTIQSKSTGEQPPAGTTKQQPKQNKGSFSICGIGICLILLIFVLLPLLNRSSKGKGRGDDDDWRGGGFGGGAASALPWVIGSILANSGSSSSSSSWGGSSGSGGGDSWGGFGGGGDFGGGGAGGDW